MIKKKAKGKATTKKATAKNSSLRSRKERNPEAVLNDIAKIVESGAKKITKAVMEQAMTGQLAPAKYLFEMASIYPASTDGTFSTTNEESLAATLLRRLNLPEDPIAQDEEDPLKTGPEKPAVKAEGEDEGAKSGSDGSDSGPASDESKQSLPV